MRPEALALPLRVPASRQLGALLLIGPAEHGQPYAGADIERLLQVVETASGWFAHAQQRDDTRRQDWLLGQIYSGLVRLPSPREAREIVQAYAELMTSFGVSIELWPENAGEEAWGRLGSGPWLSLEERHRLLSTLANQACFFSSGEGDWSCAVACLPLIIGATPLKLVATYPHPYRFLPREQEYWQIVIRHCQDRLDTLADMSQRDPQTEEWMELATLLTVLAGDMDLLMQEVLPDTQVADALTRVAQAASSILDAHARPTRSLAS
jgi:hypothetical protein